MNELISSRGDSLLIVLMVYSRPKGLEHAAVSRLAMRRSLERFDLAVGRCVAAVAGDVARAPVCSTPGWASRERSTRPAAAAAAALVAAEVTAAAVEL